MPQPYGLTLLPVQVVRGHSRPLSYVRWLGRRLLTASVDGSMVRPCCWPGDKRGHAPTVHVLGVVGWAACASAPARLCHLRLLTGQRLQGWWDLSPGPELAADPSCARALRGQGLDPAAPPPGPLLIRSLQGHTNTRNFVGLSVREADGLVACGSECGSAFAYHTSWSAPLASLGADSSPCASGSAAAAGPWGLTSPGHSCPAEAGQGSGSTASLVWAADAGRTAGAPSAEQQQQPPGLVSAVSWRPVSACRNRAILAIGRGSGHLSLAALELCPPRTEMSC